MNKKKSRLQAWAKCKCPIFYVLVFLFAVLLYVVDVTQLDVHSIKLKPPIKFDMDNGFLIKTSGCRIPFLDPFDKSILKYINKVKAFKCSEAPPLVTSDATTLYVEVDRLPYYNMTNGTALDCCYQPFWRVDPHDDAADNLISFGNCSKFDSYVQVEHEFVKIVCKVNDTEIYKDFHSFVPMKKKHLVEVNRSKDVDKVNILVLGLDSVSRLNFHRQLPRTKKFLLEKLRAIEMIGYNKVGDNTFPNLIPILTGMSVDELQQACWYTAHTKFDNCSFIWNNFSRAGYLTAYAEDSSWMGIFNYMKRGFHKQPTDYYWKTFNYVAEKEIGHHRPYNAELCMGPRPVYTVLLEYVAKFVKSLASEPHFGFFWGTSLSHDNLNYPALGDDGYVAFFEALDVSHALNRTVFIFLSDHGMRWGDIRTTHQGHLEERLPFLFFSVPEWFARKYAAATANLRRNSRRLTTPFDLHETLMDLLHLDRIRPERVRERSMQATDSRGISLFLSIPDNRTCLSANISAHWCTCQKSIEIERNSSAIARAADFIVEKINGLVAGHSECAPLALHSVVDARLLESDDYLKNNSTIRDYTVMVRTTPGGGLFEATVRCIRCEEPHPFQLTGAISRLNLYGKQSACMSHFHLKLYCYCHH